jgi:hypothetical protein
VFTGCWLVIALGSAEHHQLETAGAEGRAGVRCDVYEMQDARRTANAVRCDRDAAERSEFAGIEFAICPHHQAHGWELFVVDTPIDSADGSTSEVSS